MTKFAVLPQALGVPPLICQIEDGREHIFSDCKKYCSFEDAKAAIVMDAKVAHHTASNYLKDCLQIQRGHI